MPMFDAHVSGALDRSQDDRIVGFLYSGAAALAPGVSPELAPQDFGRYL
jgi:hypothetical protein